MRNQWRLLLLRSVSRSSFKTPTTNFQAPKVYNRCFSHLSSFLDRNAFAPDFRNPTFRSFCSESAVEQTPGFDRTALVDILSGSSTNEEIKNGLASIDFPISHQMILNVLESLDGEPEIAWKFFDFVSETDNERLSSKSYNLMLGILGTKDYLMKFWDLVGIMKRKGYGVSRRASSKIAESFEKENLEKDLEKFKQLHAAKPEVERDAASVCKVIREKEWDEEVQKKLSELSCTWSNDLVAIMIEHLKVEPTKALMFFWWVEENPSFAHNKFTYNVMLRVLGREDSIDKFWIIVNQMKEAGYQMDMDTYNLVMARFYKRRILKDAVDLYDFMMNSEVKPSVRDSVFLLHKVLVGKDLDMDLFSRALKIFTDGGNSLTESILDSLLKSLTSVSRREESGKVFKAMERSGFTPTNEAFKKIIFRLGSAGRSDEAIQIIEDMEAPDMKMWTSLIHGQCAGRDVEKASSSFRSMIEKFGVANVDSTFELLINGFCWKKRTTEAYKFLSEMVDGKELRPSHETYKTLISKLLARGSFNEALSLLKLMKRSGYPPYLDPFIAKISKSGTGTDATRFMKAMTDKDFPSNSVVIRMFEAFFKAGRHREAQNFLSECPSSIRSHADVLNLFCVNKLEEADARKPEEADAQKPEEADASAVAA